MLKICEYCGKPFEGAKQARYCKAGHRVLASRQRTGKPVMPDWSTLSEIPSTPVTVTGLPKPKRSARTEAQKQARRERDKTNREQKKGQLNRTVGATYV